MAAEIMLDVKDLSVSYGHIEALKDVSLQVNRGQIVSIIGANGAGKSTLLKTISGLVKAKSGSIEFEGKAMQKRPENIVKEGIVHVPEGRKCFSGLTVKENLQVGGYTRSAAEIEKDISEQYKLFPILQQREKQFAGTPIRRRAADVGGCERSDVSSKTDHAG